MKIVVLTLIYTDVYGTFYREQSHHRSGNGGSRNHTKKITKYGKVDRSLRHVL